ncbi:MAG: choice-of-anchor D domain-containing protein, partial [Calditrichales bacterium]|nr:choice-of-anchor D domain-containing protein [Calditrichales bacterium]
EDWGESWTYFSTPLPIASPTKVVYHPFNVAIYIGSTYSNGIHKYLDGNWTDISSSTLELKKIYEIAVHPYDPETIYVRAEDNFIYATTNGGNLWEQIYYISDGSIYVELYFDPVQPSIRYIFHGQGRKSFDSGQTWYTLPPGGGFMGDISCNDRQTLYTKSRDGLYRLLQAPELSVPAQVDAGQVLIGGNNTIEIVFENTGYAIMDISNFALSGSHTSHWQIINNHSMNLSYLGKDTLYVRFEPDSVGDLPIQLTGESTDPLQPVFSVTLNGTGGGGLLSPNPSAVNFGDVYYQTSKDTILTITNTGNENLNITSTNITGSHASMFSITAGGGSQTIEPAASHQITLRFTPNDSSSYNAVLNVASNDPYHPITNINLNGKGVVADVSLNYSLLNPIDFGPVYIGKDNIMALQINNSGNTSLLVNSIVIDDTVFQTLDQSFPFTVSAGGGNPVSVNIKFSPNIVGDYEDTLYVYSNDPDENPALVKLKGNCTDVPTGIMHLSNNLYVFSAEVVGNTSEAEELTITNIDPTYDFQIDSITINDPGFFISEQLTFPHEMKPDSQVTLHIYFCPDLIKLYSGTMTIYNTAEDGTKQVTLQGTGLPNPTGEIKISPEEEIIFGEVLVDSTSGVAILTINNTSSNYSFSIDSLVISPQVFQFNFEQTLPHVLIPQDNVDVEITFTPADSIYYVGEFYIYSDAINNDTLRVDLSGKGKYPEEPTVTFNPGTITASSGSDAAISISVDSDLPLEYVRIFYAKVRIAQFDSTNMTNSSGIGYSGTIAASNITENGLKYYFKISDGQHFIRYPAAGEINLPVTITNLDRSIEAGGAYQMISIPMNP